MICLNHLCAYWVLKRGDLGVFFFFFLFLKKWTFALIVSTNHLKRCQCPTRHDILLKHECSRDINMQQIRQIQNPPVSSETTKPFSVFLRSFLLWLWLHMSPPTAKSIFCWKFLNKRLMHLWISVTKEKIFSFFFGFMGGGSFPASPPAHAYCCKLIHLFLLVWSCVFVPQPHVARSGQSIRSVSVFMCMHALCARNAGSMTKIWQHVLRLHLILLPTDVFHFSPLYPDVKV